MFPEQFSKKSSAILSDLKSILKIDELKLFIAERRDAHELGSDFYDDPYTIIVDVGDVDIKEELMDQVQNSLKNNIGSSVEVFSKYSLSKTIKENADDKAVKDCQHLLRKMIDITQINHDRSWQEQFEELSRKSRKRSPDEMDDFYKEESQKRQKTEEEKTQSLPPSTSPQISRAITLEEQQQVQDFLELSEEEFKRIPEDLIDKICRNIIPKLPNQSLKQESAQALFNLPDSDLGR